MEAVIITSTKGNKTVDGQEEGMSHTGFPHLFSILREMV